MGVDGLGTFLRKRAPGAFTTLAPAAFEGKRVAFDMHQRLYQAFYRNGANDAATLVDLNKFCATLRAMHVVPTFVFDGKTAGLKPRAHGERAQARAKAQEALKEAEAAATAPAASISALTAAAAVAAKARVRAATPSHSLFVRAKALLADSGAVVIAANDAERDIARMLAAGTVDYAVSTDYDTLVFGAPHVVLDFPAAAPEMVRLDGVLAGLGLGSLAALVDMAILAGCDFCAKLPKVGPVTALRVVVEHGSIEGAVAAASPLLPRPLPPDFDYVFARARFMT